MRNTSVMQWLYGKGLNIEKLHYAKLLTLNSFYWKTKTNLKMSLLSRNMEIFMLSIVFPIEVLSNT